MAVIVGPAAPLWNSAVVSVPTRNGCPGAMWGLALAPLPSGLHDHRVHGSRDGALVRQELEPGHQGCRASIAALRLGHDLRPALSRGRCTSTWASSLSLIPPRDLASCRAAGSAGRGPRTWPSYGRVACTRRTGAPRSRLWLACACRSEWAEPDADRPTRSRRRSLRPETARSILPVKYQPPRRPDSPRESRPSETFP